MKSCPVCNEQYQDSVTFCANDGEVLEADLTTLVGQKLDNQYFVESLLGKGGMGAVYLARHILLGDRVALKVLPPEMQSNTEWLKRFQREGQAARRFRHPNAVTVHDLRTTPEGMIYLVMEYIEGKTLAAELQEKGRYTAEEAFFLLEPVMSVLHAAHMQGVVHRDIKPENIMVGKGQNGLPFVKLLDLGVAKVLPSANQEMGSGTKLTVQGQLLGTPFYMSPEQWGEDSRDGNEEVDGRADLYSLAVVMHEMVAGHKPFYGLSMLELRNAHVKSAPTPLYNIRPDVPKSFSDSVMRALNKERNDRHPNVQVFADELRDAIMNPQPANSAGNYTPPAPPPVVGTQYGAPSPPTGIDAPASSGMATEIVGGGRNDAQTVVDGGGADARATIVDSPKADANIRATIVDGADRRTAVPGGPNLTDMPSAPVAFVPPVPVAPPVVTPVVTPAFTPAKPQPRPEVIPTPPPSPPSSGFSPFLLAIPVVLLLLAGAAFGGWYFLLRAKPTPPVTEKPTKPGPEKPPLKTNLEYWLEVVTLDKNDEVVGESKRVAEGPVGSGQFFKLHCKAPANGYLYIVGPGEKNVPTTFLTSHPDPKSGLSTNRVNVGAAFIFPDGDDNWLGLDQKAGTDVFTIIFAPEPLTEPRFLSDQAGMALNPAQWEEFRAKFKANTATLDVTKDGKEPLVSVNPPDTNKPTIFEIRLEHK